MIAMPVAKDYFGAPQFFAKTGIEAGDASISVPLDQGKRMGWEGPSVYISETARETCSRGTGRSS